MGLGNLQRETEKTAVVSFAEKKHPATHALLAFSEVLLGGGALISHKMEVAGQPVKSILQHRVVDCRRPAIVRNGNNRHQHRQENETTRARPRRLCRRRYDSSFCTVVRHLLRLPSCQVPTHQPKQKQLCPEEYLHRNEYF